MIEKPKIRIVVDEEAGLVARLDAMAEAEGVARSDILRRAIRYLLFSVPSFPASENIPPGHPTDIRTKAEAFHGKYAHLPTSSEDFIRAKRAGNDAEESDPIAK